VAKIGSSLPTAPSADHQAVAAIKPPDAATRADVDIVDPVLGEPLRSPDVVAVIRVAAVDHGVALVQQWDQLVERSVDHGSRNH
jgi:hypothetical protein